MQRAVYATIALVCVMPWFIDLGFLPRATQYLLELFSMAAMAFVLAAGVQSRFENVRASYWIVFGMTVTVMLCSVLLNFVEPGPVVSGIRNYFKPIPFFFLGAVFAFSETQIRRQLLLLAAVCVLQDPIALLQILAEIKRANYWVTTGITGDRTTGTMQGSSTLSMFLACAIMVLVALQRRGFVSLKWALVLFVAFVFPTTINETRATFVIMPVALLVTGLVLARPGQRIKNVLISLFAIVMFGAIFIPVYDHLIQQREYGATMWSFFTMEGRAEGYLERRVGVGAVEGPEAGRLEMITTPISYLARDPLHLLFGLGMGNASPSSLGLQFEGHYHVLFNRFLAMTFSRVVLELGLLGVALVLSLLWLIFRDCRYVAARDKGLMGALAAGWTGVTTVIFIGFFYKDLMILEPLIVPYWFYSGIIVAHRMRMEARLRADTKQALSTQEIPQGARRARAS